MGVYHTQTPPVDPPMPKYTGVRHARLTHSMKRLTPALKTVLIELRYRLADDQSAPISNRVLARATGYSEGYISLLVRQLAGETVTIRQQNQVLTYAGAPVPFIRRIWDDEAGRFVITMLQPPELRPKSVAATPPPAPATEPEVPTVPPEFVQLPMFGEEEFVGDHGDDPPSKAPSTPSECGETAQIGDHADDPHHLIHVHAVAQQHGVSSLVHSSSAQIQADAKPPQQLTLPEAWPLMQAGTPGYSHGDYIRDRSKAATRALREHPDHLVVWSISRGQPVYSADELRQRQGQNGTQGAQHAEQANDSRYSTAYGRGLGNRGTDRGRSDRKRYDPKPDGSTGGLPQGELPAFLRNQTTSQATSIGQSSASAAASEMPAFLRVPVV